MDTFSEMSMPWTRALNMSMNLQIIDTLLEYVAAIDTLL